LQKSILNLGIKYDTLPRIIFLDLRIKFHHIRGCFSEEKYFYSKKKIIRGKKSCFKKRILNLRVTHANLLRTIFIDFSLLSVFFFKKNIASLIPISRKAVFHPR